MQQHRAAIQFRSECTGQPVTDRYISVDYFSCCGQNEIKWMGWSQLFEKAFIYIYIQWNSKCRTWLIFPRPSIHSCLFLFIEMFSPMYRTILSPSETQKMRGVPPSLGCVVMPVGSIFTHINKVRKILWNRKQQSSCCCSFQLLPIHR